MFYGAILIFKPHKTKKAIEKSIAFEVGAKGFDRAQREAGIPLK